MSDPSPDPFSRNWTWRIIQFVLQNVFCFWLRYRAIGLENLPANSGALLLVNHQSYLDPLLVGLPLQRPVSFLARDSLFRIPVIGWILRNTYVMPINRDSASTASLRESLRRLDHGFLVGIFPEGARTFDGQVGEFKPGFLALARRTGCPVIPVGIAGAFQALPRGSAVFRPSAVRVVFGAPIAKELFDLHRGKGQEAALIDLVRQRVLECVDRAEQWRNHGVIVEADLAPTLPKNSLEEAQLTDPSGVSS